MFANLIESQSHGKEFKRRGRFVLLTAVAYGCLFIAGGIVSIFAYDARVEAQTDDLVLLNWVLPPVTATTPKPPRDVHPIRRPPAANAPIDPNVRVAERTIAIAPVNDPTKVPDHASAQGIDVPPVIGAFRLSERNIDPRGSAPTNSDGCITCNATAPVVRVEETPPTPIVVKPPTQRVTSVVLMSKVISLPQPPYPPMAKQIGIHGAVQVQILVDETGRVISAHAVSGHPFLNPSAEQAAQRARFTPTTLNGQSVKVQGVIVYNFVLQ